MSDRWMPVEDIADYFGVRKDTTYGWIAKRDMPAHKVGRLWKFKPGEIDSWGRVVKEAYEGNENAMKGARARKCRATRGKQ